MRSRLLAWLTAFAALVPVTAADARQLIAYDSSNDKLIAFDSTAPNTLAASFDIIEGPNRFRGIDVRPATGVIYGIGDDGVLYTISPVGYAERVAALGVDVAALDFNPVVDRLRVITTDGRNLRVNPDTGAVIEDTPVAYAPGDPGEGTTPSVVGAAYTNSTAGATSTTLYDLDAARDVLTIQAPPNAGTLTTVGPLGVDVGRFSAFEVSPGADEAFAALSPGFDDRTNLYSVDLGTGAASFLGTVGPGESDTLVGFAGGLTTPRAGEELRGCTITGTRASDTIVGTPGDDIICSGGGVSPDTINGRGGNDIIIGTFGNDRLTGGAGDDQLFGLENQDVLSGDAGNDLLVGSSGDDRLNGGGGDDRLVELAGHNRLAGHAGADRLRGGLDDDTLDGGAGDDVLDASPLSLGILVPGETDTVRGGLGNDTITGSAGDDLLVGDGGNDVITDPFGGADRLLGGDGADSLNAGPGEDLLNGAGGNDTLDSRDDPAEADRNTCGKGLDTALDDAADTTLTDCESRGSSGP